MSHEGTRETDLVEYGYIHLLLKPFPHFNLQVKIGLGHAGAGAKIGVMATRNKPPVPRLASVVGLQQVADEPQSYTLCFVSSWGHDAAATTSMKELGIQLDCAIRQVCCGSEWLGILTENGVVYTMGDNSHGQLAQGHMQLLMRTQPIAFPSSRRITRLSCGTSHGGFVLDTGELFMFGCATYGRLGTGRHVDSESSPVQVAMQWSSLFAKAAMVANERCSTLPGLKVTLPSTATPPQPAPEDADDSVFFTDVSCGDRHTLTLGTRVGQSKTGTTSSKTSHIIAFGDGMNGRLGLGSENDQPTGVVLTQFQSLSVSTITPSFTAISAGECHSAAVTTTGELFTWGSGSDGQLGHGTTMSEWTPRRVQHLQGVSIATVACGARHTVAVTRSGVVYTWGRGAEGQLGVDSTRSLQQPQKITVTVDPVAAQQAQIDAQLAAGASFSSASASTSNLLALQPDTRVVVRCVVATKHSTLAVDEQSRLFVWGNAASSTQPRQVRWMDLRSSETRQQPPRSPTLEDRLRQLPRTALACVDACDAYTLLVFKTKLPVGLSASLATTTSDSSSVQDDESSSSRPMERATSKKGSWQLNPVAPLPVHSIPSREAAYRKYMAGYKVFIRRTSDRVDDEDDDDNQRHDSPKRRLVLSARQPRRGSMVTPAAIQRDKPPLTAAESVRGFAAWLERRSTNSQRHNPSRRPHSARCPPSSLKSPRTPTTPATAPAEPVRPPCARASQTPHRPPVVLPRRPSLQHPVVRHAKPQDRCE